MLRSAVLTLHGDGNLVEFASTSELVNPLQMAGNGPGIVGMPIVFLDGFEVTQEVQDLAYSVPLIAEKATIVRAYLRFARAAVTVRGELLVSRSAHGPWVTIPSIGTADLDPSRSGSSTADLQSRRADLGFSLNFRLPPALTALGKLWLRMGAVRRASGTLLPSLAWLASRTVTFEQAATLRIRLVRIRYATGAPPVTHEPSATDATMIDSWLRRAYPASRLELSTTTVTANPVPPFTADQINAQLIALRAVDVSTGTDERTHYYGMVSDGGFFMRGKASRHPADASAADRRIRADRAVRLRLGHRGVLWGLVRRSRTRPHIRPVPRGVLWRGRWSSVPVPERAAAWAR
jgi:hypothetical protein